MLLRYQSYSKKVLYEKLIKDLKNSKNRNLIITNNQKEYLKKLKDHLTTKQLLNTEVVSLNTISSDHQNLFYTPINKIMQQIIINKIINSFNFDHPFINQINYQKEYGILDFNSNLINIISVLKQNNCTLDLNKLESSILYDKIYFLKMVIEKYNDFLYNNNYFDNDDVKKDGYLMCEYNNYNIYIIDYFSFTNIEEKLINKLSLTNQVNLYQLNINHQPMELKLQINQTNKLEDENDFLANNIFNITNKKSKCENISLNIANSINDEVIKVFKTIKDKKLNQEDVYIYCSNINDYKLALINYSIEYDLKINFDNNDQFEYFDNQIDKIKQAVELLEEKDLVKIKTYLDNYLNNLIENNSNVSYYYQLIKNQINDLHNLLIKLNYNYDNSYWYYLKQVSKTNLIKENKTNAIIIGNDTNIKHKYLFILDANSKNFPFSITKNSLFNNYELDYLNKLDINLSLNTNQLLLEANTKLFNLITGRDYLHISYTNKDRLGKSLEPASIINEIKDLFNLKLNYIQYEYLRLKPIINKKEKLDKQIAKELFANQKMSITQIEKYASCPYSYFISYGLKINTYQNENNLFDPLTRGNYVHKVLEIVSRKIMEEKKYDLDLIIEQANQEFKVSYPYNLIIKEILITNIDFIEKHLKNSLFKIVGVEKKIETDDYTGKIDRIDLYDNYVLVTDYKTANKGIDWSLVYATNQIQLFKYIDVLKDKYYFGGMLYRPIKKHLFSLEDNINVEEELHKAMVPKGVLINRSDNIIKAIDSNYIPGDAKSLVYLPSTTINKKEPDNGKTITENDLSEILEMINQKIEKIKEKVLSGEIHYTPLKIVDDKEIIGCKYCELKTICHLDHRLTSDNDYRLVPSIKKLAELKKVLAGEVE